jgi:hypothetical protein
MPKKKPQNKIVMSVSNKHSILSAIKKCRLGTLKEAVANYPDLVLRTIIKDFKLEHSNILQAEVQDDQFIYQNEQRPLEVFAHFLTPDSGTLVVINGLSTVHSRNNHTALINIKIQSVNSLQR